VHPVLTGRIRYDSIVLGSSPIGQPPRFVPTLLRWRNPIEVGMADLFPDPSPPYAKQTIQTIHTI
jgi:hypothetical protein